MSALVYFSSSSENTHRFMQRLGLPATRIPLNERERIQVDEPYILVVPSYGGGGMAGAVPRQVIRFLNDEHNRARIRGVIASGNRNFGDAWGMCWRCDSTKNAAYPGCTALSSWAHNATSITSEKE